VDASVLRTSAPLNGALERTDMQRASLLMWIKPRPVRIGVGVLVLLVVVLPFLVALAASFGAHLMDAPNFSALRPKIQTQRHRGSRNGLYF
jgi:hypothetical protein